MLISGVVLMLSSPPELSMSPNRFILSSRDLSGGERPAPASVCGNCDWGNVSAANDKLSSGAKLLLLSLRPLPLLSWLVSLWSKSSDGWGDGDNWVDIVMRLLLLLMLMLLLLVVVLEVFLSRSK